MILLGEAKIVLLDSNSMSLEIINLAKTLFTGKTIISTSNFISSQTNCILKL